MRLSEPCALFVLLLLGATSQLFAETFYILETTDLRGRTALQICTEPEKAESKRILNMKPTRSNNNITYIQQQKQEVRESREKDAAADKAEVTLRQKLAATIGHDIPLYDEEPSDQQKDNRKKQNK